MIYYRLTYPAMNIVNIGASSDFAVQIFLAKQTSAAQSDTISSTNSAKQVSSRAKSLQLF